MSVTAIITDTDASIPPDIADRYQITQVPINIHFGDETLQAVVDINDAEVFTRVDKGEKYPTTSAPSPGQFLETYKAALDSGATSILCFCVSAEVSATYNAAVQAKDEISSADITIVDTRNLSMGQGFMVIAAAEAARNGASKDEVLAVARDINQRTHLFAALETLKYLAKSGRVPSLQAGIADILDMKPILTIRDGKLDLLERMRTRRKAWARLTELVVDAAGDAAVERLALIHINALEATREFLAELEMVMEIPQDVITAEMTPGLSLHGGSGLVGVVFVSGKK